METFPISNEISLLDSVLFKILLFYSILLNSIVENWNDLSIWKFSSKILERFRKTKFRFLIRKFHYVDVSFRNFFFHPLLRKKIDSLNIWKIVLKNIRKNFSPWQNSKVSFIVVIDMKDMNKSINNINIWEIVTRM